MHRRASAANGGAGRCTSWRLGKSCPITGIAVRKRYACPIPKSSATRKRAASALGGDLIGCSLYDVDPDNQLWPYHYHWNNEEWLIVVAGTPTLRPPEGERELRAGDAVGFVEGEAGAHTLINCSDATF